ncbi:MAG: hypothetical protein KBC30_07390 [Planctomycetes bacterium]|nr:hypothetical protein [Planctomycetota bacterium]HPY74791.1 hypothetical protein [Planctomycetota bacterium]HQB00432.1 hypothetical protein [Planctomycetota bacterium]
MLWGGICSGVEILLWGSLNIKKLSDTLKYQTIFLYSRIGKLFFVPFSKDFIDEVF